MWVLNRSTAEGIKIGADITITVVRFYPHKNEVCLAVDAPVEVLVHPAELNPEEVAIWQTAANDA
jgi:carbon storage regulator CsrA